MNFWSIYEAEKGKPGFGSVRLRIASRERIGLSLSTVEKYGMLLGMNQGAERTFSEEARYLLAKELTHDMLVSIYNVNTTQTYLLRFSEALGEPVVRKILDEVRRARKPNIEMRAIGLQNKDVELLGSLERLYLTLKPSLMELDLFGDETRHIAFDTKLGMSFNLLLLNRIYRPHELANTLSLEDFGKRKSELKFV
jgi:hypothetical protein